MKSCSVTYCCYYFLVVSKVDDVVDSPSSVVASADVTHGTQDDIDGRTALSLMEVKC